MTIENWQATIGLILGISAVLGILFGVLRFYIKAFTKEQLEDIKHELKPNSGSSMKDQITRVDLAQAAWIETHRNDTKRVESKIEKLEDKVDKMFDIILKHFGHQ